MKRFAMVLVVGLMMASGSELAAQTQMVSYGWEDGSGTIMGSYGNLTNPTNVTGAQTGLQGSTLPGYTCPGAHSGERYLHVAEDPHYDTPNAYIAWITGLTDGNVIDADFWGYDITAGSSPSLRIWAHYTVGADITSYAGSAEGNLAYTAGTGWDNVAWSWTFDSDLGTRDGLVIEARLYSTPSTSNPDHTDYWIDDVTVTAPSGAAILMPNDPLPDVPPTAYGKFTGMMDTDANATITLCAEADQGASVVSYTVTDTTSNGTLKVGGIPIEDGHTWASGILTYEPETGYSGLDSFRFTVIDNQPLTSEEAVHEIGVQTDGVVISEAMYDPSSFQSNYEFIEVFNYSGGNINLTRLDTDLRTDIDTTDNLVSHQILDGEMLIIGIDNTADFPESADALRCEWGLRDFNGQWVSLFESDIIRIPEDQWEYLFASLGSTCTDTFGSRILLFGDNGVLLDALDLSLLTTGGCSGVSYAYDDWQATPSTASNDNVDNWSCSGPLTGELTGATTTDTASPGYVPVLHTGPDYDDPCRGACCMESGNCKDDAGLGVLLNWCTVTTNGLWKGNGSECASGYGQTFVDCLGSSGPNVTYDAGCGTWDLDYDGDVDLYDFYLYQQVQSVCVPYNICVSIAEAPVMTYPNETEICITGAIISSTYDIESDANQKSFHIQDPVGTNGLTVWGWNDQIDPLLALLAAGDEIEITGTLQAYYAIQEIVAPFTVEVLSHPGVPAPFPQPITDLNIIINPGVNDGIVSTLVVLENVVFVDAGGTFALSTNYTVYNAANPAETFPNVRISGDTNPLGGTTIPSGAQDIVGIVTTYTDAGTSYFTLKPRIVADITPHVP